MHAKRALVTMLLRPAPIIALDSQQSKQKVIPDIDIPYTYIGCSGFLRVLWFPVLWTLDF